MGSNVTVDADSFAMSLDGILGGIENHIAGKLQHIVRNTCEHAVDVVKIESPKRYGGYSKGWRYSMKPQSTGVVGEVGNAKYPGLVHLLEKGHARVGGGRVPGRKHVATAYEESEDMFYELAKETIDEALYS